jgi:cell division protein FtsB
MRKYQKKSLYSKYLETWPAIFVLFILVVIVGWGVFGLLGGLRDTIKNKNIANAKVLELQERKARLTYDIQNLETDLGKEKIFRENYGLAKEGEQVVIIIEDKDTLNSKEKQKTGIFGAFKGIFKRD